MPTSLLVNRTSTSYTIKFVSYWVGSYLLLRLGFAGAAQKCTSLLWGAVIVGPTCVARSHNHSPASLLKRISQKSFVAGGVHTTVWAHADVQAAEKFLEATKLVVSIVAVEVLARCYHGFECDLHLANDTAVNFHVGEKFPPPIVD